MKALTISQPYASLIASGAKFVENRTWSTDYRGELAIHAGMGTQYLSRTEMVQYPTGCVIAVGRLAACVSIEAIIDKFRSRQRKLIIAGTSKTWGDAASHEYTEGPWCWFIEDVRCVEHVPMPGRQRLWNIDRELVQ